MAAHKSMLKMTQAIAVANALSARREEILKTRPDKDELAEAVSKQLGFPVTGRNVASVLKATGMDYTAARKNAGRRGGWATRAAYIRAVRDLCDAVMKMQKDFYGAPSDDITQVRETFHDLLGYREGKKE